MLVNQNRIISLLH